MNSHTLFIKLLSISILYFPLSIAQAGTFSGNDSKISVHYNGMSQPIHTFSTFNNDSTYKFTDNTGLSINKELNLTLNQDINVTGSGSGGGGSGGGKGHIHGNHDIFTSELAPRTIDPLYYYQYETPYRAYQWVAIDGGYWPDDAVIGGYDDQQNNLYICKTYYGDGMYVGHQHDGYCKIAYHGKEISLNARYGILAGMEYKWLPKTTGWISEDSSAVDGKSYVCRVNYHNGIYPGHLFNYTCHFAADGKGLASQDYEVLSTVPAAY